MEVRFAIGEVPKDYKRQIAEEERKFGAFLHIPVKVRGCAQTRSAERGDACAEVCAGWPARWRLLVRDRTTGACRTTTRRWRSRRLRSGSW